MSAQVESDDSSAHADRDGLFGFLDSYREARILVTHGDRCEEFAAELRDDDYEVSTPELGEVMVCD